MKEFSIGRPAAVEKAVGVHAEQKGKYLGIKWAILYTLGCGAIKMARNESSKNFKKSLQLVSGFPSDQNGIA